MRKPSGYSNALIARIINTLFPSQCPECTGFSDSLRHAPFCSNCWSSLKKYSGTLCVICAEPLSSPYASTCSACIQEKPFYRKAYFFGLYETLLAKAIHEFKFRQIRRLARPLGNLLDDLADDNTYEGITYVPLSVDRLRSRGFNQSLLLARTVSRKKGIPLVLNGLTKIKTTLPQAGLSAAEREQNLRSAFRAEKSFSGMNLLLVDDVMTTGSTVNACSKALRKAGAVSVDVMTVARTSRAQMHCAA